MPSVRSNDIGASRCTAALVFCGLIAANSTVAHAFHWMITEYNGPETCLECHKEQVEDVFHSVHYQWSGPTPNVPNIYGNAGKSERGFNTYCGSVVSSPSFTCSSCHTAYGRVPGVVPTDGQLRNIDCLMCHQDRYLRKFAGPLETQTYVDYQGTQRSWNLPIVDENGTFAYEPNEEAMGITALRAAQNLHHSTRASCLRCHAYAGGGDGTKRGDLSSASAEPPLSADIHMSPSGQNLNCQDCHQFEDHRFLGRGLDLRPNDRPEELTCTSICHDPQPHLSSDLNRHARHVACQTCHIQSFAKLTSTEMSRDWLTPVWSQDMFGGQGGFKPHETRASSVTPSYEWYDGTSYVYALGQQPLVSSPGHYALALPNGSVRSNIAMIYPMKEHTSNAALHAATGEMVPHSTFTYFVTGDFDRAVADGIASAGLPGENWVLVNVYTHQTINHGVEDSSQALQCGDCHAQYSGGAPLRMDLQGHLGYEIKDSYYNICTQCHGDEGHHSFQWVHNEHVRDRDYDCSWCHKFSRPEMGLRKPSGIDNDNDHVPNNWDNCSNLSNPDQRDTDRDGRGDACDACPGVPGTAQTDSDQDGVGDDCDNCPAVNNTEQIDTDNDGVGNACDGDDDNDGLADEVDNCPTVVNADQADGDNDGAGDACDACPVSIPGLVVDEFGCPLPMPGDMNRDGDVDQEDFGVFQACLSGPGVLQPDTVCAGARLDADNDVDSDDFGILQGCFSGPNLPGDPNCAGG